MSFLAYRLSILLIHLSICYMYLSRSQSTYPKVHLLINYVFLAYHPSILLIHLSICYIYIYLGLNLPILKFIYLSTMSSKPSINLLCLSTLPSIYWLCLLSDYRINSWDISKSWFCLRKILKETCQYLGIFFTFDRITHNFWPLMMCIKNCSYMPKAIKMFLYW